MPDRYQIIYSPRAAADLDAIFRHIEQDSLRNAASLVQQLLDAVDSLDQLPYSYPVAQGVRNQRGEVRVMPVSSYLVYYRVLGPQKAVRLITVRHGARRRPRRLD